LVRAVGFASAFSFKYSARPGTPGALMSRQIPDEVKSARLLRLQELLNDQQRVFNRSQIGRRLDVLFEKEGRHPGQLIGRSPYLQPVVVDGPGNVRIGDMTSVEIIAAETVSLWGRLDHARRVAAE
jgi:tRNA-2-methylthio-N6-dimethylallyladenosine synthase